MPRDVGTRLGGREILLLHTVLHLDNVGLGFAIVGVIFLANSIAIRNPRRFIQEFFGIERERPLRTVLDQLKAKAQIFCGFLFLMVGFSLQIVSDASARAAPEATSAARWQGLVVIAIGVVLVAALLRVAQHAWAMATFRRLLAEFFLEHRGWAFEKHPAVTREIGELLSVAAHEDDSISDYAERVRAALGLGIRLPRTRESSFAFDDDHGPPVHHVGSERRP